MRLFQAASLALLPTVALGFNLLANIPERYLNKHTPFHGASVTARDGSGPATDEVWNAAICKGARMMKQMAGDDYAAGQLMSPPQDSAASPYSYYGSGKEVPDKWGWKISDYHNFSMIEDGLGLEQVFNDLGISVAKEKINGKYWVHAEDRTVDGVKYPATNGTYFRLVSPDGGALVSLAKFSPAYMARLANPPIKDVVPFGRFSDIAFYQIIFFKDKDGNPFNLRYLLYTPVENDIVLSIITRALATANKRLSTWPGLSFPLNSEDGPASAIGQAILGSPYGTGVSFLLFSHKKDLGNKIVERVAVFQDGRTSASPRLPSLLFHIKDAPN